MQDLEVCGQGHVSQPTICFLYTDYSSSSLGQLHQNQKGFF